MIETIGLHPIRRTVSQFSKPAISLTLVALISACTQVDLPSGAIGNAPQQTLLDVPDQKSQVAALVTEDYLIGPMDRLDVKVIGFPEFGGEAQVDFGGNIQLPLVGSIPAAGRSAEQLTGELAAAYDGTYLKRPQVSIAIKEVKSRFVTVEGSVKQPGLYPLPTKLTLTSAIAMAEGQSEFASEKIAVFRTIRGQKMAALFNTKDIRNGIYADPDIYSGDVIVVGDSPVRRIFRDIIQTAPLFAVFRPFSSSSNSKSTTTTSPVVQ